MSHDPAWKRFERQTAASLHTLRTPLSGSASRITSSDSLHPDLYVEAKFRRHNPTVHLFRDTAALAAAENKIAVLALRESDTPGAVAVMAWSTFVALWEIIDRDPSVSEKLRELGLTWKL